VRQDPRLPVEHLPGDWPAVRAEQAFHRLHDAYRAQAQAIADAVLETVDLTV
jgi:phenylacetic acid degradation operon negative regulatory protein